MSNKDFNSYKIIIEYRDSCKNNIFHKCYTVVSSDRDSAINIALSNFVLSQNCFFKVLRVQYRNCKTNLNAYFSFFRR